MNRPAFVKRFWLLAVGVSACLSIAGCSVSGSAEDRGSGGGSTAATPASSATPLSGGDSSPPATTTSQTTTPTVAPTPPIATHSRTASEVSIALLDTFSFVPGVHVVTTPAGSAGRPGAKITSDNPKCAPLVAEANTPRNAGIPGVTGYADVSFQGDGDAHPFFIEEITTVGTAKHAADLLASVNDSIRACTKLTISLPGARPSTMTVSPEPAPAQGDHPTAAHIVGSSGASRGTYITVIVTGREDAVITLTFIDESESDIQGITKDAVERASAVFLKTS